MIQDIQKQLVDVAKERVSSPLYGTFIFSWIIWNWRIFYITFFVDQKYIFEKTTLLKIEYINTYYSFSSIFNSMYSIVHLFIGPIFSVYLITYLISIIDIKVHKKALETIYRKNVDKLEQEQYVAQKEGEKFAEIIKTEKIANEVKKDVIDEELWNSELSVLLTGNKILPAMQQLKNCIYGNNGNTHSVNPDILSFLHLNNLVVFTDKDKDHIETTEKGKYFLKRSLEI